MSLQTMLQAAAESDVVTVDDGWGQGRATYGGLVAALGYTRMEAVADLGDHKLRSVTTSFVAPVLPGEVAITARVLRHGSSVTQTAAEIYQDGRVAAAFVASFGQDRDSAVSLPPQASPNLKPIADCERIPVIPQVTPEFFQQFELLLGEGELPYTGKAPNYSGYMRHAQDVPDFSARHLVALADAWPPASLAMLPKYAPASSLTWTLQLLPHEQPQDPRAFWGYEAFCHQAAHGNAVTEARVWSPTGELAALSYQNIAMFG